MTCPTSFLCCHLQIQVQLPLDLVTGLNSQLHAKQHSTQPTALLSTEGCILPDTTIFLEDILACDALANTASAAHKPLPSAHGNASQSGSLQLGLGQEGLGQIAQHQHASGHKKPAKQRHQEQELHPALCVEIKPKWGLLPSSPAIPAQNDIKKRVSRFQLHQQLKLAQVTALLLMAKISVQQAIKGKCMGLSQTQQHVPSGSYTVILSVSLNTSLS